MSGRATEKRQAPGTKVTPSPPSDRGEGWGKEGHSYFAPLLRYLFLAAAAIVVIAFSLALLATPASAQVNRSIGPTSRSVSGQFLIQAGKLIDPPASLSNLATNPDFIRLDPTLLAVSCERIKTVLNRELGASGAWRGKIFVALYPAKRIGDPVTITSDSFRDGWQYRVELPNIIERERYLRALVQSLLLEMANRNVSGRSAEIPLWLVEGLSRQLLASNEKELILSPPRVARNGFAISTTMVSAQREDPVEIARKQIGDRTPLSFDQLSWPPENILAGADAKLYGNSALLFVNALLDMKDGRDHLRTMLEELPKYYNWQLAFLEAFRDTFRRTLDVEKWWTLHQVHFAAHERMQIWPAQESWQKLNDTLRVPVQIHTTTNELPLRADVPLQTVINDWDRAHQIAALTQKLRELQMLHLRISPDFAALVEDYHRVLETYLANRDKGFLKQFFAKGAGPSGAAREALEQLNALDARRTRLRPQGDGVSTAQTGNRLPKPKL